MQTQQEWLLCSGVVRNDFDSTVAHQICEVAIFVDLNVSIPEILIFVYGFCITQQNLIQRTTYRLPIPSVFTLRSLQSQGDDVVFNAWAWVRLAKSSEPMMDRNIQVW